MFWQSITAERDFVPWVVKKGHLLEIHTKIWKREWNFRKKFQPIVFFRHTLFKMHLLWLMAREAAKKWDSSLAVALFAAIAGNIQQIGTLWLIEYVFLLTWGVSRSPFSKVPDLFSLPDSPRNRFYLLRSPRNVKLPFLDSSRSETFLQNINGNSSFCSSRTRRVRGLVYISEMSHSSRNRERAI